MEKISRLQKQVGAVLTDLNHDLLIAKFEAYGFNTKALTFIRDYPSQRTEINSEYRSYRDIKFGVPQGSILGPLLFNMFLNDIFFFVKDSKITNYADDNTPYAAEDSVEKLLEALERETNILLEWFNCNEMKSNTYKCHLIIANNEDNDMKIGNGIVTSKTSVKLLGVTIENKLNFNEHVDNICKNANNKLHALARIAKYLSPYKLRILMKTFIESQFNYCPLTWMFHSRQLNSKINKLQERALRIVHKNPNLTLLDLDKTHCIPHRNLQKLAVEMYNASKKLVRAPIQDLFPTYENTYNHGCWKSHNVRTVGFGTETFTYRGHKTWHLLPDFIRNSQTLKEFKAKIKHWTPAPAHADYAKHLYITLVLFNF